MGVMQYLRDRISNGATVDQLVEEGYKKSSIYAAKRSLDSKVRPSARRVSSTTGKSRANNPNKYFHESLPAEVVANPEIQELQLELAKTKLTNDIAAANGFSRRLQASEERLDRVEQFVVGVTANIAESVFGSDPKMLEIWQEIEMNHLRNGGPHWNSDQLAETDETKNDTDETFDWYAWAMQNDPELGVIEARFVDSGYDSVEDWLEAIIESMRQEGVPWKVNGVNN